MAETGFVFLDLPVTDKNSEHSVDYAVLNFMVDSFLEKGGRYFDTSHTEEAIKESLVKRHKRDSFILADKLPSWIIRKKEDCQSIFEKQLSRCGPDFFDIYFLQWINEENYISAEMTGEFDFIEEMKSSGKVKETGFSFFGTPELLDKILSKHPEIDYVQLQINYLDFESHAFRSKECCEVAKKHGKKIIAAEFSKSGNLLKIPQKLFGISFEEAFHLAFGFIKNLPEVEFVLLEFKSADEIERAFKETSPLSAEEVLLAEKVTEAIRLEKSISCNGCGLCKKSCPLQIPIPEYFEIYNEQNRFPEESWKINHVYSNLTRSYSRPSDCLRCRLCESICPEKINIVEALKIVSRTFGY